MRVLCECEEERAAILEFDGRAVSRQVAETDAIRNGPYCDDCPKHTTPEQGDLVGRDRVAEIRDALPPGYMELYGR